MYRESRLDEPVMAAAKQTVEFILSCREPFPALVIDRHWNLGSASQCTAREFEPTGAGLKNCGWHAVDTGEAVQRSGVESGRGSLVVDPRHPGHIFSAMPE